MTQPMRYAVVGAGAIGAYVGAALSRGGAEVTLIARGAHLEAMRRDGVRVHSPRGDFHAKVEATDDLAAVAGADVVFLGLKSPSLPELAPKLAPHLKPGAAVIAAQNGIPWWYFQSHPGGYDLRLESVDPGGVVSAAIAPERVIGCVIYCSTEISAPGTIRHIEGTRYAIGEPDGSISDRCLAISDDFVRGGLKCPVETSLREQIWLKLLGNVAFNPVSALTGATLGELGTLPEMRDLLRAVMEESASIATALGVELPVSIEHRLERGIAVGDHKTSMLQDVEAGKALETDCLTEAVIELAEQLGIDVPHTRTLHACVKLLEARVCAGSVRRPAALAPEPAPVRALAA
jgi:2-dehydropantoate 2-reductase